MNFSKVTLESLTQQAVSRWCVSYIFFFFCERGLCERKTSVTPEVRIVGKETFVKKERKKCVRLHSLSE